MHTPRTYSWQFWLLCLSSLLFFASFNMIIPELPAYMEQMGATGLIGWHITLFTIMAGVSRPLSGRLTDRWGRIPVMVFGVVVCVAAGVLYPFVAQSVGLFLFLRFFHGFSTGFKPTATSAFVADIVPDARRGEAMGLSGMAGSLGMASGPYVGSIIARDWGLNAMFYASSALALLSVLILMGMKETLTTREPFRWSMLKVPPREWVAPQAFPAAITVMLSVYAFGVILTVIPDFTISLGFENKGIFFAIFTLSSLSVRFFAGRISDRYGRVPVLRVGLLVLIASILLLATATTQWQLIVAAAVMGLAVGNNTPTLFAWTIDLTPVAIRGRGLATMFIALEIGIGVAAFLAGWMYNLGEAPNYPLILGMPVVPAIAALVYLWAGVKNTPIPQSQHSPTAAPALAGDID